MDKLFHFGYFMSWILLLTPRVLMPKSQIAGKRQTNLLLWLILPFLLASLLNGVLISVVRSSLDTIEKVFLASDFRPEIAAYEGEQTGLVTFWFDDAWRSQYSEGVKQLTDEGLKGALAVPTELVGYPAYMTWEQVIEAQELGWEINAHSRRHYCNLEDLDQIGVNSEVLGSRYDLENRNLYNEVYVLPCGVIDDRVRDAVLNNYEAMRTTDSGINSFPLEDPYSIKANTLGVFSTLDDVERWIAEAETQGGLVELDVPCNHYR